MMETIDTFNLSEAKKVDKLMEILKEVDGDIKWETKWSDYETFDGQLTSYISLCVPLYQEEEARDIYEEVLDEFESLPTTPDEYEIYIKVGEKVIFNEKIQDFVDIIDSLCISVNSASVNDLSSTLNILHWRLPQLYLAALELPQGAPVVNLKRDNWVMDKNIFNMKDVSEKYPYSYNDIVRLSDLLKELITQLTRFEDSLEYEKSSEIWATAVWNWHRDFRTSNGWGGLIIKSLDLVQKILENESLFSD